MLAFLGTECPLAKLYGPRLAELQKKYADKGVQFLGVNSNRQDAITEIAAYARVHHIDFPILKDLNNKLADQLGAVADARSVCARPGPQWSAITAASTTNTASATRKKARLETYLQLGHRRTSGRQDRSEGRDGSRRLLHRPRARPRRVREGDLLQPGRADPQ